jgi:hypothetical protein
MKFAAPPESDSVQFNLDEQMMRQHSKKRIFRFSLLLYCYNAVVFSTVLIPAIVRYSEIKLENMCNTLISSIQPVCVFGDI